MPQLLLDKLVEAQVISSSSSMSITCPGVSKEVCQPSLHVLFATLRRRRNGVAGSLFAEPHTDDRTVQPRQDGQRASPTMKSWEIDLWPLEPSAV